ncbi:MAG TPA: DUF2935 domain-containing protein [Tepidimicrobium sp.]|nr:DUF2935 domain-containing protein [Tepidimicrobium sp.]
MLDEKRFIQISLELNLFFARIMKEHMIFMEAGLLAKNSDLILEADQLKRSFEKLLGETVDLSDGVIRQATMDSNEFVTPYTLELENMVESLTGICIDTNLTLKEMELEPNLGYNHPSQLGERVFNLNNRIINLIIEIINFKDQLLSKVEDCKIFTFIYPSMQEHLIREAKFYLNSLINLQERKMPEKDIIKTEVFWDEIMGEHAKYIRGMLDPTEEALFNEANDFAILFEKLTGETIDAVKQSIVEITKKNLKATEGIKEFKSSSAEGLLACEIKSIINPLLADHVLREANRYIRVLKTYLNTLK